MSIAVCLCKGQNRIDDADNAGDEEEEEAKDDTELLIWLETSVFKLE